MTRLVKVPATLLAVKRSLIEARISVQDAGARAQRSGDAVRARRLREIAARLADELDEINRQLGTRS
jgi:hypothetical protein